MGFSYYGCLYMGRTYDYYCYSGNYLCCKEKTKDKYSKNLPDAAGILRYHTEKGNSISDIWKRHSIMIIIAGAVVLLQCLIVIFYKDTTVDAAYYVGTVSTSVYTDTLGRYNPYNGIILKVFQARYVFCISDE